MRKLLSFMLLFATVVFLTSCRRLGVNSPGDNYDTSDSAQVAEFVNSIVNPQLMSVEEVLSLKNNMLEKQSIDSAFLALDNDLISTVTTVLLKKKQTVTKKDILEEYRRCSDVYDNLPNPKANVVDKSATDLGTRQGQMDSADPTRASNIVSNGISFRTDTINGKPVRVKIQTIESYE